jgi:uncharacterized protein with PQ loop repeat
MTDARPIRRCEHKKRDQEQCKNNAMPGRKFCYLDSHCGDAPLETRVRNFFQNNLIWTVSVAIIVFLGGILTLFSYLPQLSLSEARTVRSHDAMGTIFNLTNNGLPVFGVEQICRMTITRPNGSPLIFGGGGIEMTPLGYLGHGKTKSLNCHHAAVGFNMDTDLIIEIRYRPLYLPWKLSDRFPLRAEKADDGTWVWKSL